MHIDHRLPRVGRWARRAWLAPLLLALFGCGGGGGDGATGATAAGAPPATMPAEMSGQWEAILTYVPPFYSGPYGDIAQGDGSLGITLILTADGRYRHFWNVAQAYFNGNCFRNGGWDEFGTVSGTGPEYTFNPAKATYAAMNSCGKAQYLDPAPVAPGTHRLTLEHDANGWPLLRVQFPTGDIVLEKCRHC